jgi:mannosyltransferase OCH1-like enzyme
MIPRVVYQCFKTNKITDRISNIIERNKSMCPDFEFKFYDDDMCEEFIKNNFESDIYEAYKKINPRLGAMKSDFWRYCILFKNGGIYIDIKILFKINFADIVKDKCILDLPHDDYEIWRKGNPTYEQYLLIFPKEHEYLSSMIKTMTSNILNEYRPVIYRSPTSVTKQKILQITGPDAFSKIIKSLPQNHTNINYYDIIYNDSDARWDLYKINGETHYSMVDEPIYI